MGVIIKHFGALGDQGFTVPAIRVLREQYNNVWLFCKEWGRTALGESSLISRFIVKPADIEKKTEDEQYAFLVNQVWDLKIEKSVNFYGMLAGRYTFHPEDEKSNWDKEKKIENAKGVNFFDIYSEQAGVLKEAKGMRPTTRHTELEKVWLKNFRHNNRIPEWAFLLGWQFTGSSMSKIYPYFGDVVQKIMYMYPHVYLVTTGDLRVKDVGRKYEYKRWINLVDTGLTFRQAYLLTSIYDCFVGPDTGVMVFAQGYETPKILLNTIIYDHYAFPETVVLQSDAPCSPCYNTINDCSVKDGDNPWTACVGGIAPEFVIAEIEKVILQRSS